MTMPATLTVSTTNINNSGSNIDSNKRKSGGNLISARSTENHSRNPETGADLIRMVPTFRIPKKKSSNDNIPSPDSGRSSPTPTKMETNNSISTSSSSSSNNNSNSQSGKRKFSLNQYKEHKRLKSNDTIEISSADIDMRIDTTVNIKNSSPTHVQDNASHKEPTASPKSNEKLKDVVKKSNLSEPGVKKLIKQKVIWADEKNKALVETSFFEVDDSELTEMHAFARQCATNISIAQVEKLLEHDLRKQRGLQEMNPSDNNDRQNLPSLPTLRRILLPNTITIPIVKSQERFVQEERERNVLQAFFIRPFLPDNPSEPDGDLLENSTSERNEPKSIPFDDNASSSVSNSVPPVNNDNVNSISTPPVTPSLSIDNIISPEVAQILAQAKGNLTSANANPSSSTIVNTPTNLPLPPITNTTTASSLLSALLNITKTNGIASNQIPPVVNPVLNVPLNFNFLPSTNLSVDQLLASALALGMLPPTTFKHSMFQQPLATSPSSLPIATTNLNSNHNLAIKSPLRRPFSSAPNQRFSRFNNHNESQIKNFRGNNRGHNYRRGLHNNNNTRRNYYPNRNNNNNNNNLNS